MANRTETALRIRAGLTPAQTDRARVPGSIDRLMRSSGDLSRETRAAVHAMTAFSRARRKGIVDVRGGMSLRAARPSLS